MFLLIGCWGLYKCGFTCHNDRRDIACTFHNNFVQSRNGFQVGHSTYPLFRWHNLPRSFGQVNPGQCNATLTEAIILTVQVESRRSSIGFSESAMRRHVSGLHYGWKVPRFVVMHYFTDTASLTLCTAQ